MGNRGFFYGKIGKKITKALKKPWINWKFVTVWNINCTSSSNCAILKVNDSMNVIVLGGRDDDIFGVFICMMIEKESKDIARKCFVIFVYDRKALS